MYIQLCFSTQEQHMRIVKILFEGQAVSDHQQITPWYRSVLLGFEGSFQICLVPM